MAKTFKDLMDAARRDVPEWSIEQVKDALANAGEYVLIDVREKDEYREGHLEGALSLPRGFLEIRAEQALTDRVSECDLTEFCLQSTNVCSHKHPKHLTKIPWTNLHPSAINIGCRLANRCSHVGAKCSYRYEGREQCRKRPPPDAAPKPKKADNAAQ